VVNVSLHINMINMEPSDIAPCICMGNTILRDKWSNYFSVMHKMHFTHLRCDAAISMSLLVQYICCFGWMNSWEIWLVCKLSIIDCLQLCFSHEVWAWKDQCALVEGKTILCVMMQLLLHSPDHINTVKTIHKKKIIKDKTIMKRHSVELSR